MSSYGNLPERGVKTFRYLSAVIVLMIAVSGPLYSESVFMKDGAIIDGKVVSENDNVIKLRDRDKKIRELQRSKVLRVSYEEGYKKRMYLKRRSGKTIEGHIVDESAKDYTIRDNLDSPAEYKVEKSDIIAVSAEKYVTWGTYYALGLLPGAAQLYADRNTEGVAFMGLAICSLGFMGYEIYDVKKKHDDYKAVPRGSAQSEFDSKYDDYKKSVRMLTISAGIFAAVYLANWVDVIFFAAPDFDTSKGTTAGEVFYNLSMGEVNSVPSLHGGGEFTMSISAGYRF